MSGSRKKVVKKAPYVPDRQHYAVMALAMPKATSDFAINNLGCFPSLLKADEYIKRVRSRGYTAYDLYRFRTNCFGLFPPEPDVSKNIYDQEGLNDFMKPRHSDENGSPPKEGRVKTKKTFLPSSSEAVRAPCLEPEKIQEGFEKAPFIEENQDIQVIAIDWADKKERLVRSMCILGAFDSWQSAQNYIDDIQKRGFIYHDIYKIRNNEWITFPPPANGATAESQQKLKAVEKAYFKELVDAEMKITKRSQTNQNMEKIRKLRQERKNSKQRPSSNRKERPSSRSSNSKQPFSVSPSGPPPGAIIGPEIRLLARPRKEDGEEDEAANLQQSPAGRQEGVQSP